MIEIYTALYQIEGVHRALTPRRALDVVREVGAWIWIRDREQGYHNKRETAISHGRIRRSTREQQSHTEEQERIRRIARGVNNSEYIVETAVSRTTALMNVKVILQVAYMSAFRPSFCLNGSFVKSLVTDRHTHTHTGAITLPLRKRGVTIDY